jgi:hypothetical protein
MNYRPLGWLALTLTFAVGACSDDSSGPRGPVVTVTSPLTASLDNPITSTVSATFSRPIEASTVTATSFTVSQAGPVLTPVAGAVAVNGSTVTFTPSAPLEFDKSYIAKLTTDIEDASGNPLGAVYSWGFGTHPRPKVNIMSPLSAQTGVARNTTVSAVFSQPIVASSVTATSFTLTPAGTGAVPVTGTLTVNGNTVTFTPSAPLAASTVYTARFTTDITDDEGAKMAAEHTWTFTTGTT